MPMSAKGGRIRIQTIQRLPLLNVVGFNQATKQYTYTVNENFGVLQKAGNPLCVRSHNAQ
jgi:hypothetical protein